MKNEKSLSKDQLALLNGSNDIQELTVNEMFDTAGGQYGGGGGGGGNPPTICDRYPDHPACY